MSWSFNPFTGNLDLVGGGAVVFEGEVETFADLPETVGDPAVGASYLVRTSTGVWLVNRRQAGIWIRRNNTGVRATDWEYGGDYPVNSVNGQTGNVSLTASSVGAAAATHASTHHTGGTDAIAPNNISAAWAQVVSSQSITGNTVLSSGRNRRITLLAVGVTANVDLPFSGNQNGDILTLDAGFTFTCALTIRRAVAMSGGSPVAYATLGTLTANGQALTVVSNGTATGWSLVAVDTHTHAAADVTSGVFDNARINFAAPDSIGSTTRNTGAFTTLNANNGTITASAPVLDLSQTWNNAAVTFTGLRFNVTNTASAAASLLTDFQVGGTSAFRIRRDGATVVPFTTNGPTTIGYGFGSGINATHGLWCESGRIGLTAGNDYQFTVTTTGATVLSELRVGDQGCILRGENSAANQAGVILAQRNGTNPQEYRLYNTYSSSGANHERLFLRWSSNVLQIGTEKAGTGSARALELQSDGITRLTVQTTGTVALSSHLTAENGFVRIASAQAFQWLNRSKIYSLSDGNICLVNSGENDFGRLQFGGTTSSFPALKRSSTALQVRLADDSADAPFSSGAITTSGTVTANNTSSGFVTSSAPNGASPVRFAANTGDVLIQSANAAGIVEFRGTTGTNPQSLRVFNTFTSGTSFERLNIRWASNECIIDAEAGSGGGTLRGIKIGSATSSLLGFYGATPVTQRAAIADATDAASTQARLNDLLAAMRSLGIIAT